MRRPKFGDDFTQPAPPPPRQIDAFTPELYDTPEAETMRDLKTGDTVVIFEDPITRQKAEGVAVLVRCEIPDTEREYWTVRFDDDSDTTERWIYKGDT